MDCSDRQHNSLGARLLFAQAKARLDQILLLVGEFNEISRDLAAMGYGPLPVGDGQFWPMPYLDLSQNQCEVVEDSSILDAFWEMGPSSEKLIPMRRSSRAEDRLRLGRETNWTCFYCHGSGDSKIGPGRIWHVDHVYPVVAGGDDLPDNLVLSCATCNLDKKAKTANEYFANLAYRRTTRSTVAPFPAAIISEAEALVKWKDDELAKAVADLESCEQWRSESLRSRVEFLSAEKWEDFVVEFRASNGR